MEHSSEEAPKETPKEDSPVEIAERMLTTIDAVRAELLAKDARAREAAKMHRRHLRQFSNLNTRLVLLVAVFTLVGGILRIVAKLGMLGPTFAGLGTILVSMSFGLILASLLLLSVLRSADNEVDATDA